MRPIPILLAGPDGQVQHANPAATALLGAAPCITCDELVRAEDPQGGRVCKTGCPNGFAPDEQRDHGLVKIRGRGWRLICSAVSDSLVVTLLPAAAPVATPRLSAREKEVLQLVAGGLTGHRIARRLGITPATVRTHVEHIRDKLGVRSRSQAVARALALGQIE
ncbi:MAG: helix-turn-helix transcriptional regulator [Pseudomonadota bacterium]|nr:helix-turn-helix transcriptional regulator [Pseudomonadota bacterium]